MAFLKSFKSCKTDSGVSSALLTFQQKVPLHGAKPWPLDFWSHLVARITDTFHRNALRFFAFNMEDIHNCKVLREKKKYLYDK